MLELDSGGALCTSYRSAVRFVGGDEIADIIVDLAVDYADEHGHDITAFATDVIVDYVERQCVPTEADGPTIAAEATTTVAPTTSTRPNSADDSVVTVPPAVSPGPVDLSPSAAEGYALLTGYEQPIGHVTFTDIDCPDNPTVDRLSTLYECQADSYGEPWTVLVMISHDGSGTRIANAWVNEPETVNAVDALPDQSALTDFVELSDVAGYVGPIAMPDGTEAAVLTRSHVDTLSGSVELAVQRADGWHVAQTYSIENFVPDAPVAVGDLTGDGLTEIRVPLIASTGGKGWDLLYRTVSEGPSLHEIPFDTSSLEALGIFPMSLHIDSVAMDQVVTTIGTCNPSCAEDAGTLVKWYLDRSNDLILRPVAEPPAGRSSQCPTPDVIADALTATYGDSTWYHSVRYFDIECSDGWASASEDNGIDGGFVVLQHVDDQWIAHDLGTGGECSDIPVPDDVASQIC